MGASDILHKKKVGGCRISEIGEISDFCRCLTNFFIFHQNPSYPPSSMSKRPSDTSDDVPRDMPKSSREHPVLFVLYEENRYIRWLVPFDVIPGHFAGVLLRGEQFNQICPDFDACINMGLDFLKSLEEDTNDQLKPSFNEAIGLCLIKLGLGPCLSCEDDWGLDCDDKTAHDLADYKLEKNAAVTCPVYTILLGDENYKQ